MAAPVAALQSSQAGAGRPKTPAGHRVLRGDAVGGLGLRQHGVLRGCAQHGAGRRQPVAAGMWRSWDESPVTGARLPASLTPRLLQGPAAGASCTGSGTGPPLHWPPEVQQGLGPRPDTGQEHGPTPRAQASRRALQLPNLIGPISAYDKNLRMDFSLAEEGMIWSAAQFYEPYGCPS